MPTTIAFGTAWESVVVNGTSVAPGTTVTPGNNTYGAYAQLLPGSSVPDNVFGIQIQINSLAVSAAARGALAKIAVDPGGATSFAGNDVIPDLLCGSAGVLAGNTGAGVSYYFPLAMKAGSAIGCAMSVNNPTVGTGACRVRLFCKPSTFEAPRTGSFVRAFGINAASSSGTVIVPNSVGAKSAYVKLGAAAIAAGEVLWWWCLGVNIDQAVSSNNGHEADLAGGSSTTVNRPFITDQLVLPGAAETMSWSCPGVFAVGNPGDFLFARAGGQAVSPTGLSYAAYGMGG